jgi:biopolymer transport protein ExbD
MTTRRRVAIAGCLAGVLVLLLGARVAHRVRPADLRSSAGAHASGATLIVIDSRGRFYVNGVLTAPDDLVARVRRAIRDKGAAVVYLKGDKNARYASILDAMETLRDADISVRLL